RRGDRACLRIDPDLGEVAGVAQGFEDAGPLLRREVDVTDRPVIEEQSQSIVVVHGYADNGRQIGHHPQPYGRGAMGTSGSSPLPESGSLGAQKIEPWPEGRSFFRPRRRRLGSDAA